MNDLRCTLTSCLAASLGFASLVLLASCGEPAESPDRGDRSPGVASAQAAQGDLAGSSGLASAADPIGLDDVPAAFRRLLEAGVLPPATPAELSARTSGVPSDILEYVRANFDYDPYSGALRGSQGVLLAGGGNDVDVMLLLHESIAAIHPDLPVRYAYAPMTPAHSEGRAASRRSLSVEDLVRITGLTEDEVQAGLAEDPDAVAEMEALDALVGEEARFLTDHLGDRITPRSVDPGEKHWWMQVREGDQWVDLDPASGIGDSPEAAGHMLALPDPLYHRMVIELELERAEGNEVQRELIYQRVLRTADVAGKALSLILAPEIFDPADLPAVLASANLFQAVSKLDDDVELSRVFDLEGDLYQAEGDQFSKAVEGLGSDVGNMLARRGPPQASHLTAVILRIAFSGPGVETRSHERWIVDRLDRDALASGHVAIAPEWEDLVPVRAALIRSYHLHPILGPENETSIARTMAELVLDTDLNQTLEAMVERQEATDPTELSVAHDFRRMTLGSMTFVAQALGAGSEPSALRYSGPGLILLRESLAGTQSNLVTERAIDVVSGGAVGTSMKASVRYGAALSHSERDALGPEAGSEAVAETLARARTAGVPFSVIDTRLAAESLSWPPEARASLSRQVESGFVTLVPELRAESEHLAWWRVDPDDGIPIATDASGEGQAAIEGTMVLREISIPQVERTLAYVACLNASVLGGASLNQAGGQCLCRYLGGQVGGAAAGAAMSQAVGTVTQAAGLGPKVAFMLGAGAGYLQNAAGLTPGRPVQAVCQAMMP